MKLDLPSVPDFFTGQGERGGAINQEKYAFRVFLLGALRRLLKFIL
jgi:hypothetical protein